ncbi:hypothetical protein LCGC14_0831960 [marine sediment metagenome]|uniref:Peptidase C-terminal archaeal/bacterial domain-containing protein n=1 Tax=marine sediment metagenome TaxID=412755 RepID=A0A0F9S0G4_9ZZZZ|nr:MAG: hypothetical protein Lokiarch_23810 [Candidatus Lokiarchaeum sp. GC14_75]HEC40979.1 hypothetical protein [bacterium]
MKFRKNMKLGVSFIFLLLTLTSCLSLINLTKKNNTLDKNTLSLSATIDDYMENNDSFGNASWVTQNNYTNLMIIESDEDWFQFNLNTGDTIDVEIYFNHSKGNLDLELYDPLGANISRVGSYSTLDYENLTFTSDESGAWRIRVYHYTQNTNVSYDLYIWVTPVSLSEDNYETNNFVGEAFDLTSYAAWWLSWVNGTGIQWDEDWYIVYLDPGEERIYVELKFNHSDGDIDLEVYYYNGPLILLDGSYSIDDNEYIDVNAPWSGIYYIRVFYANNGNEYDLWWEDLPHFAGTDDYMEDNDDFWQASSVNPSYYSNLMLMGYDDDWYQLNASYGDILEVDIYFLHADGDLELEIWDPFNTYRIGSYTSDDDEYLTFTADLPGEWRIHVYHVYGDSNVNYDLNIWFGMSHTDDEYEENDDYYGAAFIDPINGSYPSLELVYDDDDWFQFYLNFGDTVDIGIFFNSSEGDLELELWDPLFTHRLGSYSSNDDEFITYMADRDGYWRIRVYNAFADSKVSYHLEIKLGDSTHVGDDPYEKNDFWFEAYWLGQDEQTSLSDLSGLAVQGQNYDWYAIEISPGFLNLQVKLNFTSSLGNINIAIHYLNLTRRDPLGNPQPELEDPNVTILTFNNSHYINDTVSVYGIYFIEVWGDNQDNEYDLWWDDIKTWFSDDRFEENDDFGEAKDIILGHQIDLDNINLPEEDTSHETVTGVGVRDSLLDLKNLIEMPYGLPRYEFGVQLDNDYYQIEIEEGFRHLIFLIKYDFAEGVMGLELYDWNFNKLAENFTMSDNEIINYVLPSNGTYYIKIFGDNTGNVYYIFWAALANEDIEMIPGYDLLIVLGAIIGISTIVIKKKRSKFTKN